MPIHITCQCGRQYTFKDEFAGNRSQCPACHRTILIQPRTVAEVEDLADAAAAQKSNKGVLIFAIAAGGAVILLAAGLLIAHYAGDHSPRPAVPQAIMPEAPTQTMAKAALPSPVSLPPGKAAPAASAPIAVPAKKSGGGPEAAPLPKMTPAELLLPLRAEGANYFMRAPCDTEDEDKKMHDSFRTAHITTVGAWLDWLGTAPDSTPATAFLRSPLTRARLAAIYENRAADTEEKETIEFGDEKNRQTRHVTWLQYQDVGFAVDEVGNVIAVRITAWPAKPAPPAP